jgi:DNA-binding transcriptional ArsR family regulator
MVTRQGTDELDALFEALANRHRRAILHTLSLHPSSISRLADERGLSLPAIHKHIKVLEDAGMVTRRKLGRTNFLALDRRSLRSLQEWLTQFHAYWGSEQESLENYAPFLTREQPINEEQP